MIDNTSLVVNDEAVNTDDAFAVKNGSVVVNKNSKSVTVTNAYTSDKGNLYVLKNFIIDGTQISAAGDIKNPGSVKITITSDKYTETKAGI